MDLDCTLKDLSNGIAFVQFWKFFLISAAWTAGEDGCFAVCNCPRVSAMCDPRFALRVRLIGLCVFDCAYVLL